MLQSLSSKLTPVTFMMGKIMDQLYQTYQMEIRMVVLRRQVQRIAGIIAGANNSTLQRSKKWLVRGLVKFATAVARLDCPDLLG